MANYTAEQIADTLIHLSRERGLDITNLKLQKLLYYAQAWHLAFHEEALFQDAIEAWIHGPVVPSVFRKFKSYRWNTIDCAVYPIDDASVLDLLNSVMDAYGAISAISLEHLTHSESPWKDARAGIPFDEPSHNIIRPEAMQAFYLKLAESNT